MPPREELGDNNPMDWPAGLDKAAACPLVLSGRVLFVRSDLKSLANAVSDRLVVAATIASQLKALFINVVFSEFDGFIVLC
jgi:hypothetical protein